MQIIEPHIHMYARTTDDYEAMKKAGYVATIEPAFWSGTDRSGAVSYYDYFRHLLEFEHNRAAKYGIYHYSLLGVNAKEARNTAIAFEVIKHLDEYLKHPNCLGVGEIGLDLNTPDEVEVLRRQVRVAERNKLPVIIHSPHTNKRVGVERIIQVLEEEQVGWKRYVMDHNTEETIEITLSKPEMLAGITLYPTKLNNARVAELIKKYGADRILINSSADWGKSYPLNVAQAAAEMPDFGVTENDVRRVIYDNAFRFFSQSPKFKV
ncbi:MAG: TatD family hydrolase [Planctomycetota bacterium]